MTGFFSASFLISRHMRSEARASPPGLSTLNTTASTDLFLASDLSCLMKAPAVMTLPDDPAAPSPPTIAPTYGQTRVWMMQQAEEASYAVDRVRDCCCSG